MHCLQMFLNLPNGDCVGLPSLGASLLFFMLQVTQNSFVIMGDTDDALKIMSTLMCSDCFSSHFQTTRAWF